MAHPVEIKIFFIAKSQIDPYESDRWLSHLGVEGQYDYEKTGAEALTELAGRRCYLSFEEGLNPNVTKIRTDLSDYIENILKSGHGSVLEHASYTFSIEGVSRVFTAEMNRHRAGWAISEGSMRYIRLEDMGYWEPPSIQPKFKDKDANGTITEPNFTDFSNIHYKKWRSRDVFRQAFKDAEKHYKELQEIWKDELAPESKFHLKKEITSMMRRIVPMGIATGGIWTGNIRAIRHVLEMRTTPAAEEEICFVFSNIMKRIADEEPNLFGDFEQDEVGFFYPKYRKV